MAARPDAKSAHGGFIADLSAPLSIDAATLPARVVASLIAIAAFIRSIDIQSRYLRAAMRRTIAGG